MQLQNTAGVIEKVFSGGGEYWPPGLRPSSSQSRLISSRLILWLTADCESPNTTAALVMPPCFRIAESARNESISSLRPLTSFNALSARFVRKLPYHNWLLR